MPTYIIRNQGEDIVITSADIQADPNFRVQKLDRGGPGGTNLEERIFLDWMIKHRLDDLLMWHVKKRTPLEWRTKGTIISSGINGAWIAPNIFRDTILSPFTVASNPVGKMIHVLGGQGVGKNQSRSTAVIINRINDSRVTVEGEIPAAQSELNWNYRNIGSTVEAFVIISSMA